MHPVRPVHNRIHNNIIAFTSTRSRVSSFRNQKRVQEKNPYFRAFQEEDSVLSFSQRRILPPRIVSAHVEVI